MSFYEELGVERNASANDIKKAYRALAMRYHPDKADEGDKAKAEERFKLITEAYTVLSDDDKRKHYDMFGTAEGHGGGGGGGGPMHDMNDIFKNMFGSGSPFGDMFNPFGGGGGPGRGRAGPSQDMCHCDISFEELYNGTMKKIEYEVVLPCQTCNGVGATDPADVIKCMQCGGKGIVVQQMGPMILQTQCPACFGNCTTIKTNRACGNCKGKKFASYRKTIKLDVPKGIPDRFEFRLAGKGNYNREAACQNDLVVIFSHKVPENCSAVVDGGSITHKMNIKLDELFCGFSKTVNLFGRDIKLVSQGYFNPHPAKPMRFKGAGLPIYKKDVAGDLIVEWNVVFENDARLNKYLDVFLTIYKRTAIPKEDVEGEGVYKVV